MFSLNLALNVAFLRCHRRHFGFTGSLTWAKVSKVILIKPCFLPSYQQISSFSRRCLSMISSGKPESCPRMPERHFSSAAMLSVLCIPMTRSFDSSLGRSQVEAATRRRRRRCRRGRSILRWGGGLGETT